MAGGAGTRLYPLTKVITKQLLPIYDKPLIYYPISVLMLAGIKNILIISSPEDINHIKRLLGDGSDLGLAFSYLVQPSPDGLAQAFLLGKDFIGDDSCAMILGDNIFYGSGMKSILARGIHNVKEGYATIFGYYVNDPERFGIMEFDENWNIISVEEKPKKPKTNYWITGLYFYPSGVYKMATNVKPSSRGELEITSLNDMYLQQNRLKGQILGRGFAWLDTGTMDSLFDASNFVQTIEKRQGLRISVLEEIAYRQGWIDKKALLRAAERYANSPYGEYLKKVADGSILY